MKRSHVRASVQRFLHLRDITDDMLCLAAPSSPSRQLYRAILEVTPINFPLKSEDEQEAIIEHFRALIHSLAFPIQILVRNQRLDIASYLDHLQQQQDRPPGWRTLATSVVTLLAKIAAQRTLIERHVYVVVPASSSVQLQSNKPGSWLAWRFVRRTRHRNMREAEARERARQELALRAEALIQQFAAADLVARRLQTTELVALSYSCLTPERAMQHPLTAFVRDVGRPKSILRRNKRRATHAPDEGAQTYEAGRLDAPSNDRFQTLPQEEDGLPVPQPGLTSALDMLAPESLLVTPDYMQVGREYCCGIAITEFPREVPFDAWLKPLLLQDDLIEIVFHIHPQSSSLMARQLQRHLSSHVAGRRFNERQGRTHDPDAVVAEEDVRRMLGELVRQTERVVDLGFYILVRATSRQALEERTSRIFSVLSTLLLDAVAHRVTFEQAEAFCSCLPEGRDELRRAFTLDATSVATIVPFLSNSLTMPGGVLLGLTETSEPVLLNPWDQSLENPHTFIGGVTGAGKSYLGKLMIERDLLLNARRGDQFFVIDPDLEYGRLAEELGGTVIRIAPGSTQHLNPFDLLPPGCDVEVYLLEARKGDRLAEKIQDLHAMLDILLAESHASSSVHTLTSREKGLLDRVLYETYRKVGISDDPRTHDRQAPLLRDCYEILTSGVCGADETDLSGRLYRYVHGSLSGLFSDQTDVNLSNQFVVWDLRDMRSELRPLAIYLIADCVWTQALYDRRHPRSLFIDEAASIIEHAEGGRFLATLSRRARKRYLRLVTMTQNPEQFVQDAWGSVVASNTAIKILKMQDSTSIAAVVERFHLTRGEQQRLLTLSVQEALVLAGDKRVIITIQASPQEHALITTNPVELVGQPLPPCESTERVGAAEPEAMTDHRRLKHVL